MLTQNVGMLDRIMRIIVGLALIAIATGYVTAIPAQYGAQYWGWIGVIPLLTGLFGTCPVYSVFGLSTCATE